MSKKPNANIEFMCFKHDKWINVAAMDLNKGDQFFYNGKLMKVKKEPDIVDGQIRLRAEPLSSGNEVIVLAVGEEFNKFQTTLMIMDLLNTGCKDFGDGTYMIAELEFGPGAIYSPRLSREALEKWCVQNLARYKAFIAENKTDLDDTKVVKMTPWW